MKPKRIQRKRTKGWRMPEGAVYVGRPSMWGNPYPLTATFGGEGGAARVVGAYRAWLLNTLDRLPGMTLSALRGRDLVCWCPLDQPCHADVLLELANA